MRVEHRCKTQRRTSSGTMVDSKELHAAHHARQKIAVQRSDNLNATLLDVLHSVRIASTTEASLACDNMWIELMMRSR